MWQQVKQIEDQFSLRRCDASRRHQKCPALVDPIFVLLNNKYIFLFGHFVDSQYNTMNIIQKAWLKVLGPVIPFVNEKLAKRSGLLGKLGRFFAIGPREFGYHPLNRMIRYYNRYIMEAFAYMLHRYSFWKSVTGRGYHMMRPHRMTSFILPFYVLSTFFYLPRLLGIIKNEEGTDLEWLASKEGKMVPNSALNFRKSAHYTEINSIYGNEMLKRYSNVQKEILAEYANASEQEKKTRYAHKGYSYLVPSSKPDGA